MENDFLNKLSLHSERYLITIEIEDRRYKVMKIIFGGKDGSLYVSFPYFKYSQGIVSIGTVSEGTQTTQVKLETAGKVTSHLVKYARHPDGRAHFSQDGKILTKITKQSVPLAEAV